MKASFISTLGVDLRLAQMEIERQPCGLARAACLPNTPNVEAELASRLLPAIAHILREELYPSFEEIFSYLSERIHIFFEEIL